MEHWDPPWDSNKITQKEFYNTCCIYLINIKFYFNIFNFNNLTSAKEKEKLALLISDCDDD